jgi:hypothetical protein
MQIKHIDVRPTQCFDEKIFFFQLGKEFVSTTVPPVPPVPPADLTNSSPTLVNRN